MTSEVPSDEELEDHINVLKGLGLIERALMFSDMLNSIRTMEQIMMEVSSCLKCYKETRNIGKICHACIKETNMTKSDLIHIKGFDHDLDPWVGTRLMANDPDRVTCSVCITGRAAVIHAAMLAIEEYNTEIFVINPELGTAAAVVQALEMRGHLSFDPKDHSGRDV